MKATAAFASRWGPRGRTGTGGDEGAGAKKKKFTKEQRTGIY